MTALIEVRNSSELVGRCDASCYEAQHAPCECVCRGRNHGAGIKQATSNIRELAQGCISDLKARRPEAASFKVPDEIVQLALL